MSWARFSPPWGLSAPVWGERRRSPTDRWAWRKGCHCGRPYRSISERARNPEALQQAQAMWKEGDALVKQAAVWETLDKKASLLTDAICQYQMAWQTALD